MTDELAWSTLVCRGRDAATFLNGQLSQDVATAAAGAWSLLLDPSGVVVTSLWLRERGDEWELLVPTGRAAVATSRLRRFLLRVDCTVDVRDGAETPPLTSEDERFAQRLPWTNEFAADLPPHSFGAHFVASTVSFTKGCFTGQELVGRMDARGANMPWRVVTAVGPSREIIDHCLRECGPAGPQGVTSSRERDGRVEAFGVAHRSRLTQPLSVAEVTLEAID